MGYMRHNAIVVTSHKSDSIKEAHKKAIKIFSSSVCVSNIVPARINGYESFFIGPDGSKEGWLESDIGNQERFDFVKWLRVQYYDDGSSRFSWAEIQYGDEVRVTKIIGSSDDDFLEIRKQEKEKL